MIFSRSPFIKKGLLLSLIAGLSFGTQAFAKYGYNNSRGNNGDRDDMANLYFPFENNPQTRAYPPEWKKEKFHLELDENVAEEVVAKRVRFKKIMNQTYNLDMLMTPIVKPFKTIDKIYITTEHITTVVFPMDYTIVAATGSKKMTQIAHSSNILTFQPKRDFIEGNIVVSLTNGETNKVATIILERYVPGMTTGNENYSIKLAKDKQFVSTVIMYKDLPKDDNTVILEAYFKLYGPNASDYFSADCKFDTFTYDGVQYYVIRDDKFGNIEYEGISYRIANSFDGCGEISENSDIFNGMNDEVLK